MSGIKIISGKIQTPLGDMLACVSDKGLSLLEFTDRKNFERQIKSLEKYFGKEIIPGEHPLTDIVSNQINEYFFEKRTLFDIPLYFAGTEFQKNVWNALKEIPYGKTVSYSDIAKRINKPAAVRAVANATGANKISLIVPCHRIIGKNGTLTGYAGGLYRKKFLLNLEKIIS